MKFSEWLKNKYLLEADSGRNRMRAGDITNKSIGSLGPYGTFGHKNLPTWTHDATSGFLGGIAQAIQSQLSPVDSLKRIEKLRDFDLTFPEHSTMLLQLPFINGQQEVSMGQSNTRQNFNNTISKVRDPDSDPRVRKSPKESPEDKFELFNPKDEFSARGLKMGLKDLAITFTTTLQKIKIYNKARSKNPKIDEFYDFQNPTIDQQKTEIINGHYYLATVFTYKKKKSAVDDQENDGGIQ